MTTKEKAKAYDEALERARKIHSKIVNDELLGFPGQIEDIFSELCKEEKPLTSFQQCLNCILRGVYYAEVPDEKVNEFILNVVRTRTDELIKLAKKQEEQKHPDGCFTCNEYKKGYEAGRLNGFTAGYNKAMKEVEQKEQNPAEVDESTKRLNDNWMKQHFDDYEEQKSAQSREEILHQLFQNGSISLSDYLYLTGEQKPAEWSEEDEKMLENIRYALGYAFVNNVIDKQTTDYVTTWLKYLRPRSSWRPSEEQMEAFCRCVDYLEESDNEDADIMAELYEQLKQL